MIYCKSWKDRSCEVGFAGEGDVVLDEIATLLAALHRDVLKRSAQKASEFRNIMREMTEKGSMIWRVDGKAPEGNLQEANQSETSVHYDRLCAAAKHFGLAVQKAKTKEEMDELAELLGDYSVPDRALRAARIEELADVYNMLDQLCILWDCEDEVRDTAERKMERTMERIASGYYEGKANG